MKKLIFLLVATVSIFTSCTKDDSDVMAQPDPIIGTWKIMTQYVDDVPVVVSECQKTGYLDYKENGSFEIKYAYGDGTCTQTLITGTFTREFSGKYHLKTAAESKIVYAKFTYNNTQLDIEETIIEGGVEKTYRRIYVK
jgi:hypothetical protein